MGNSVSFSSTCFFVSIDFEYVIRVSSHCHISVGYCTRVVLVDIDSVISLIKDNQVIYIYSTTEELNTIIIVGDDFNVINSSTRTYTTKGKTVDFITVSNSSTTVTDG